MPYGSNHGHTRKETNSQPQGRSNSKTSVHMGPANSGAVKTNKQMDHGLGRSPRGKVAASKSSKQYGG
jgi:hypothetical protein